MKVKMLTSIASKKYSYAAGSEVDIPKKQAEQFIKAGVAVPIEGLETSTAPDAKETTSTRKGRKKNADDSGDGKKAT